MPGECNIVPALEGKDLEMVRLLFMEYAAGLDFSLCFQDFDKELASLPGDYAPPRGVLLVAQLKEAAAGCVGVRPLPALGPACCEMKRLYVRKGCRGLNLGRQLAKRAVLFARESGYKMMCLDTVSTMTEAIMLYKSIGFIERSPYCYNPVTDVCYMQLAL